MYNDSSLPVQGILNLIGHGLGIIGSILLALALARWTLMLVKKVRGQSLSMASKQSAVHVSIAGVGCIFFALMLLSQEFTDRLIMHVMILGMGAYPFLLIYTAIDLMAPRKDKKK